jgi:hypothetical protein
MLNIPTLKEFAESPNYRARIMSELAAVEAKLQGQPSESLRAQRDRLAAVLA